MTKKNKRKSLTNKVRFEIFKRDSFKCQYCGKSAPDVVLEVDHIIPVAKGGTNDILNLVTSCHTCNSGKSDRKLDDFTEVEKQKKQLDELNERRKQLEMMIQWRKGLNGIEEDKLSVLVDRWDEDVNPFTVSETGKKKLKRMIKKYDFNLIMDSIEKAIDQYIQYVNGEPTKESAEHAFNKIEGIIKGTLNPLPDYMKELYYIRGIMKNRFGYVNEWQAIEMLKAAYEHGDSTEEIKAMVLECRNWTEFRNWISDRGLW